MYEKNLLFYHVAALDEFHDRGADQGERDMVGWDPNYTGRNPGSTPANPGGLLDQSGAAGADKSVFKWPLCG